MVYGRVDAAAPPVDENYRGEPHSPYAVSKACAELVAGEMAAAHELDVVIARPFNFAGPGQGPGFVCADFARQIARIEAGLDAPVLRVGNLQAERDFTDVRDFVRGLEAAARGGGSGRAYNLCSGTAMPIRGILDHLLEAARCPIEVVVDRDLLRPVEVPRFVGDARRAQDELDWKAEIPLRQTLRDTLDWWRARVAENADDA
jgi:GDP-4-dehydro-6-deoxy-D-mannose reductase